MIHSAVVHFYIYINYYSSSIGVFSRPCSSLGNTEYFYNVFAPCFTILIDYASFRYPHPTPRKHFNVTLEGGVPEIKQQFFLNLPKGN